MNDNAKRVVGKYLPVRVKSKVNVAAFGSLLACPREFETALPLHQT